LTEIRSEKLELNSQSFATLGSSGIDDFSTIFRGHSSSEAVSSFSFDFAGLKGSFHLSFPQFLKNF
jgi:hypothetical protein